MGLTASRLEPVLGSMKGICTDIPNRHLDGQGDFDRLAMAAIGLTVESHGRLINSVSSRWNAARR